MTRKGILAGIPAVLLVLGMVLVGCDNGSTSDSGGGSSGMNIHVRHFAQTYQDEIISRVTIYEYDDSKAEGKEAIYQNAQGLSIKYGESWTNGSINKVGKYLVEVEIGEGSYKTCYAPFCLKFI